MGIGSFFMDKFGDGSDDYTTQYDAQGNAHPVVGWRGYDPNAAGQADDTATATGNTAQDRQTLLNQAAGINQTAQGMNATQQSMDATARGMSQTAGQISGLSDQLGNAPSAARAAASAAGQTANANALSQAASARGANSALMMREAMSNNDARSRGIASDAAASSAAELSNRFGTRANMLNQAAGVQGGVAGVQNNIAGVQANQVSAQNAAGGLQTNVQQADLTQRGQGLNATQGANQLQQTHDDAMYAGLVAKHNKSDADSGGALDSAFSMLGLASDMRLKTDIEPIDSGKRTKNDRRKLADDNATESELAALLRKASEPGAPSRPLDTSDVRGPIDTAALDEAQRRSGSRVYGGSSQVPTARFADYQPPTARFADAPARPALRMDPGYDLAALDDAYRRQSDPSSYMVSDERAKTSREKLLDMATKPEANEKNLSKVEGYSYRYKPEAAARFGEDTAPRPGIMAQDLEKAPAGADVVDDTPDGKVLDVHRALGFSLAGVAGLDKRLQRLEAAAGGNRKKSKAA